MIFDWNKVAVLYNFSFLCYWRLGKICSSVFTRKHCQASVISVCYIELRWKFLISYETTDCKIKIKLRIIALKTFVLTKSVFNCISSSQWNEARRHFELKNALFLVLVPPATNFEEIWNKKVEKVLAVVNNNLQKVSWVLSLVQCTEVVNWMPLKLIISKTIASLNFVQFHSLWQWVI